MHKNMQKYAITEMSFGISQAGLPAEQAPRVVRSTYLWSTDKNIRIPFLDGCIYHSNMINTIFAEVFIFGFHCVCVSHAIGFRNKLWLTAMKTFSLIFFSLSLYMSSYFSLSLSFPLSTLCLTRSLSSFYLFFFLFMIQHNLSTLWSKSLSSNS